MATTNLFSHPVFKDGAFTANDPQVRRYALRKTLDAIDLGAELGAEVYVMWGGREGVECDAAKDVPTALDCYAEAINLLLRLHRRPRLRARLRPRAQAERAARRPLPPDGRPRARVHPRARVTRDGRAQPRVRPRDDVRPLASTTPSRRRSGPASSSTSTSTRQRIGKYDQDFRFGSEGVRDAFYLVKLLEDARVGRACATSTPTPTAPRTSTACWDFARGCMRTYLILDEKARALPRRTPEIQEALAEAQRRRAAPSRRSPTATSPRRWHALRAASSSTSTPSPRGAAATSASTSS